MEKTRRILFVDDLVYRWDAFREMFRNSETSHVEFVWAKDYDEAIAALKNGKWDVVFLDHDLEDPVEYDTKMGWRDGSAIVDWIREHTPDIGFVVCHSMNPVARKRMSMSLQNGGYKNVEMPFYAFDSVVEALITLISCGNSFRWSESYSDEDDQGIREMYGG